MKLERLSEYLTITVTIVVGMLMTLYVGSGAGGGDTNTTLKVSGAIIATLVALIMRADIWLLIPIFWPLTGQVRGLPGAFPLRDLAILYVFPVFLALKALKVVRTKAKYNWLDYLLFLNISYLVTVFIRNPVGTESMGFERIGGKAYFDTFIVLLGYWVIGHVTISPKLGRRMPLLMICGDLFTAAMGAITTYFPATAPIIGQYYTGISMDAYTAENTQMQDMEGGREGHFANAGYGILRVVYSFWYPFTTLNPVYLGRVLVSALGIFLILRSGFRSTLIQTGAFFLLAAYFQRGFPAVVKSSVLRLPLLVLLVAMQGTVVNLPFAVQRTLSFLPGQWDAGVVENAQGSVDWRHDIWKDVLDPHNKYIDNWWFGDGFGMTRTQLREALDDPTNRENLVIAGAYHSLPLSAIHTVGYIGFGLFCLLIFGAAWYGFKLIEKSRGSPFFVGALFLGVPAIWFPWPSLLLSGFYDAQMGEIIFLIAMMRLFDRSLQRYHDEQKESTPEAGAEFPEFAFQSFPSRSMPSLEQGGDQDK